MFIKLWTVVLLAPSEIPEKEDNPEIFLALVSMHDSNRLEDIVLSARQEVLKNQYAGCYDETEQWKVCAVIPGHHEDFWQ